MSIDKTNSAAVRKGTQCAVNKVVIGKVSLLPHVGLLLETVPPYCRCLTEEGDPRRHAPLLKCHLSGNGQRHHRKEEKVCRVRQSECVSMVHVCSLYISGGHRGGRGRGGRGGGRVQGGWFRESDKLCEMIQWFVICYRLVRRRRGVGGRMAPAWGSPAVWRRLPTQPTVLLLNCRLLG